MIQSWAGLKGLLAFCQIIHYFKGTVIVILSVPPYKDSKAQFTTVPLKLYSDKKCKRYTVVFWLKKVFISSFLAENPQMKINSLKLQKHWYLIHTWSDNHVFLEWDWDNGIGTIGLGQWDLYQLFPTSFNSRNHCEFLFNSLQI